MATKKATAADKGEIFIQEMNQGVMDVCILGKTPLIMNRMSQKVWFELLAPRTKTRADRAQNLKHDPFQEFRASPYRMDDPKADTLLAIMPTAFKKAMGTAALDMPGAKKTQVLRLVYVEGSLVPVYGVPRMFMSIVRSADMSKTPDVRTRAILPEWACRLTIRFTQPTLNSQSIANLLAAAGFQSGVGDWRQEKGSGNYGSFALVSEDDPDFLRIMREQGRAAQEDGIANPVPYDMETGSILEWFVPEMKRRGHEIQLDDPGVKALVDKLQIQEPEAPVKRGRKAKADTAE